MLLYPFEKELGRVFLILISKYTLNFVIQIQHIDGMVDALKDECKFDCSKLSAIPQQLFDVAKLYNIGSKVMVESKSGARESRIRKSGRPKEYRNAN